MDMRDTVTGITAAAVVGTGTIVGGGQVLDNMNDGPQKRRDAELTELQQVVDQHNQLLEQKNAAYQRFTELQGALKTLKELEESDGGTDE